MKNTQRIVELISKSKENLEANMEFERQDKLSHRRDQFLLGALVILWLCIIVYTNYFAGEE